MSLLSNTIRSDAFWLVNKKLAHYLKSIDAALFLADLVSKKEYFKQNNQLDEYGGFFNTTDQLEQQLLLTESRRRQITNQLVTLGLLKVVKRGLPSKNYYYIQEDKILEILCGSEDDNLKKTKLLLQTSKSFKDEFMALPVSTREKLLAMNNEDDLMDAFMEATMDLNRAAIGD